MQLKCLAGAYAGQILTYSTPVGLAALRSGTAARIEDATTVGVTPAPSSKSSPGKRLTRPRARE